MTRASIVEGLRKVYAHQSYTDSGWGCSYIEAAITYLLAQEEKQEPTQSDAKDARERDGYHMGFEDGWMRCGTSHIDVCFEDDEQRAEVARRLATYDAERWPALSATEGGR